MASTLIDAGPLVSLFADHEPHSAHYQALLQRAAIERRRLCTTWPCVVEASHLLAPANRHMLLRWVSQGGVSVFPFQQESLADFVALMERYTEEPRTEMDLADATLVWLAEETGVTTIMTTDHRDFSRYRLSDGRAFEIL
ncbi:MAG: PIN domain-containing protein [Paucibacter sp.]|nr:PIN domain-containing protein [Roseateles sp.]